MTFDDLLDGLIAFGRVVASKQGPRSRAVLLTILGDRDASSREERHTDRAAWGLSPILYRPAAPQGTQGEEVIFLRRGDDAIVLASRDLRWQVELSEGEAVIRGLGPNAARIRCKADGSILIEGGQTSAAIPLSRDDFVQTELAKIAATLATGSNSGGPVVFATPYVVGSTGSQRVKVDR